MRTCFVTENFYPEEAGGVSGTLSQLVRHLHDAFPDFAVDVIASANPANGAANKWQLFEEWNGVRIFRIDTPRSKRDPMWLRLLAGWIFTYRALHKLRRLHREQPYDLICVGTNPPTSPLLALAMKLKHGVPYLYILHDLYPDMAVNLGRLTEHHVLAQIAHRSQQRWLDGAGAVVVQGRCCVQYLSTHYRMAPEKLRLIENWSNPEEIVPLGKTTSFRAKHGLTGFVVLYSGNIGYAQRFDTILDAAKIVGWRRADITFVLIGGGGANSGIDKRIRAEKISNVRRFPSVPRSEYPDLLASADVSLVTHDPAVKGLAVPSKIYNIMASCRPAIALVDDDCEVADMLRRNDCGLQVEHDDGSALADAIESLCNAGATRLDEMGRNARAALERSYTLRHIGARYHQLMLELTGKKCRELCD